MICKGLSMKQITWFFLEGESPTLIVLGAYAIRWPKCARSYFKTENDVVQNLIDDFFLTLTVIGPFHRKDFKWKKIWGYEVNFCKNGSFACEFTKEQKQPPVVIQQQPVFYKIFILELLTKNHWKIRFWIFLHIYF